MTKRSTQPASRKTSIAELAAGEIIATQKEAAEFAGVSARTVRRWVRDGMLTASRAGKPVYIRSQLRLFAAAKGAEATPDRKRELSAQADGKEIKAQLLQLELEIRTGRYIQAEEVEKKNVQKIQVVGRALSGVGRKLAPQLAKIRDERKIKKLLDSEMRHIREAFAKG